MKNAYKLVGIIALALVIGFSMAGCPSSTSSTAEPDTWTDVTDSDQIIGTWKGSFTETFTKDNVSSLPSNVTMKIAREITAIVVDGQSPSVSEKQTWTFSGQNSGVVYNMIKDDVFDQDTNVLNLPNGWYDFDDSTKTIIMTPSVPPSAPEGIQINQSGTKLKVPAGSSLGNSKDVIFTKQN